MLVRILILLDTKKTEAMVLIDLGIGFIVDPLVTPTKL